MDSATGNCRIVREALRVNMSSQQDKEKHLSPAKRRVTSPATDATTETSRQLHGGEGWAVVLFDDEEHYRGDVLVQLIKALRCSAQMANAIIANIEQCGYGVVIITSFVHALHVDAVLREIKLKTKLRKIA